MGDFHYPHLAICTPWANWQHRVVPTCSRLVVSSPAVKLIGGFHINALVLRLREKEWDRESTLYLLQACVSAAIACVLCAADTDALDCCMSTIRYWTARGVVVCTPGQIGTNLSILPILYVVNSPAFSYHRHHRRCRSAASLLTWDQGKFGSEVKLYR